MRRRVTPSIVIGLIGMLAGLAFRYLAGDPAEASFENYARSGLHAMGIVLFGRTIHLYFTCRDSGWLRRRPLWFEILAQSLISAIVVAGRVLYFGHPIPPAGALSWQALVGEG